MSNLRQNHLFPITRNSLVVKLDSLLINVDTCFFYRIIFEVKYLKSNKRRVIITLFLIALLPLSMMTTFGLAVMKPSEDGYLLPSASDYT